jgi:hypothetical protein
MNFRETWERIGISPRRLVVLLIGFAVVVFVVSPLARFFGVHDVLGFTCDSQEKAALMEFSQYGGKVIGEDIQGPLGGETLNFPRFNHLHRDAHWGLRPGTYPRSKSLLTTRRS